MELTVKVRVLNAVDAMLDLARDDVQSYLEQADPWTANDERNLRECQEQLLKLTKFRKAFVADRDYDTAVLLSMVRFVMDMEMEMEEEPTVSG